MILRCSLLFMIFLFLSLQASGKEQVHNVTHITRLFPALSKNQKIKDDRLTQMQVFRRVAMRRPWSIAQAVQIYEDHEGYCAEIAQEQQKISEQLYKEKEMLRMQREKEIVLQKKAAAEKQKKDWVDSQPERVALFKDIFGAADTTQWFVNEADKAVARGSLDDLIPVDVQKLLAKDLLAVAQLQEDRANAARNAILREQLNRMDAEWARRKSAEEYAITRINEMRVQARYSHDMSFFESDEYKALLENLSPGNRRYFDFTPVRTFHYY